jgi:hypothetical protein
VQSIVRYDYYPHFKRRGDGPEGPRRLHAIASPSVAGDATADWRTVPVSETARDEPRTIDFFRLSVAAIGLTIYLGPPVAGIFYLAFKLAFRVIA